MKVIGLRVAGGSSPCSYPCGSERCRLRQGRLQGRLRRRAWSLSGDRSPQRASIAPAFGSVANAAAFF